jgi:CIC family chloride channel protein
VVGALAGLVVAAMSLGVTLLHALLFGVPAGQRLSSLSALDPYVALAVPTIGGLIFGTAVYALARWRPLREVDPIEANALHGGRMSLYGSLSVALQTVWSSGVGASVGLEAGYTQLASGIASRIGQAFRLRRRDLRLVVGCGAAGAIAGAFGAPLAGAFYAFELIIGSYSVASLAPVGIAALVGYVVANMFDPTSLGIGALYVSHVDTRDLAIASVVGLAACRTQVLVFVRADNIVTDGDGRGFMMVVREVRCYLSEHSLAQWNGARGGRPLQAAARAYIRFMFHAIVTRLHSPWTWSRPRRRN